MSHIPSAFHRDYDPATEEQPESVPRLTMHEFLHEIAEFIRRNASSEDIELYQPDVLHAIARVLHNRHASGWSLESDLEQQLQTPYEI
jgi:hypothetical protein